ncbi:flagellin [Magnetospirillum sp. UT-4]|uniref:flagellin n=1 Tax=Magnetospirillum sp. UT-4 TaxID=2681467 RepID=UPI0013850822|nr:flagellin [Magnetospirillum sp. UT-4]CAA7618660.1 Flagellin [Magnetospirillum sp. UT-4]
MGEVTLSTAVRSNLLSLQNTADLVARTQNRLSTNQKVSSPVDDAVKYFQGKALSDRAGDLSSRKSGIEQGISSLKTATEALGTVEKLLNQMKGVLENARSGNDTQRVEYNKQFGELANQIQRLVTDSSYGGLNLLNSSSSTLSVRFSDKSDSKLEVTGYNLNSSGLFINTSNTALGLTSASVVSLAVSAFGFTQNLSEFQVTNASQQACLNSNIDTALKYLDSTISDVRAKAATLGNNVAILQTRSDFTTSYVNLLNEGAGKLTLADLNEEGANLLALQTRQQLGIQALSFAGQSEQGVLGLFR